MRNITYHRKLSRQECKMVISWSTARNINQLLTREQNRLKKDAMKKEITSKTIEFQYSNVRCAVTHIEKLAKISRVVPCKILLNHSFHFDFVNDDGDGVDEEKGCEIVDIFTFFAHQQQRDVKK